MRNFARPIHPMDELKLGQDGVEEKIRPSGFYKQKSSNLLEVTRWYLEKDKEFYGQRI